MCEDFLLKKTGGWENLVRHTAAFKGMSLLQGPERLSRSGVLGPCPCRTTQGCTGGCACSLLENSYRPLASAQDLFIPGRIDYSQATQDECIIAVHL